ncbi:MAG: cobalamin biosynthesis protein [Epulopiscium sp.]|nr:cobalamin biosynthesis protein [Candidatus Epulonipiscium sp.]
MIDILIAVILDFILGDPYGFPHPVIYIGKFISYLEEKGRKICKTSKALKLLGLVIVILVCLVSFAIPYLILRLTKPYFYINHIINIGLLWTSLAATSLRKEGLKVYDSLIKGDIEDSRIKLSYIVGRDTESLNREEIIRADIETITENTADGVIAPLLYGMIGGAPLAMLYKGINTMDSMLGYVSPHYKDIGFFPAKVDDLANLIPARLTGFLFVLVSPLVKGNIIRSARIMIRDRKNHKSPNCAYPEGAAAGALGIQLGGDNNYFGQVIKKPTIGEPVNKLEESHIQQAVVLMYSAEILLIIVYMLLQIR